MKKKRIFLIVAVFVALLIVLYFLLPYLRPGERNLVVSGRIEADEINLSARTPGRASISPSIGISGLP
ncbi:MAG: hypothetical protein ACM34I_06510 [bacterium]